MTNNNRKKILYLVFLILNNTVTKFQACFILNTLKKVIYLKFNT